jgi:hypothetical protein
MLQLNAILEVPNGLGSKEECRSNQCSDSIAPIGAMFSSPATSALSRRHLLKSLAAFSATAVLAGCNKSQMISATATSVSAAGKGQPVPAGTLSHGLLEISTNTQGSIEAEFIGLSYEKSAITGTLFSGSNEDLISLFRLLGPGVLRVGGNAADQCFWTPNGPGRTAGQIAPSDVDALASFLSNAGWHCIYGINLGGAASGTTSPELAAAEAAYVTQKLGSFLVGFEIGNECDGYGVPGSYFAGNWSLGQFESLWYQFRTAIAAAAPGVPVTAPASGSTVARWTVPFSQAFTKKFVSLVTQHYYRGDGKSSTATAANLLSPDANLTKCLGMLNAASQSTGIPFRLGECNSFFNGGASGVSNSYASALWVTDFLFNCALGGAAGVNLHGGGNYASYTPIADKAGAVVEVRPEFYGIMLFALAGQGTLLQTSLSAGGINATAYTVRDSSGNMNIMIINKDSSQNLHLTISMPQKVSSASLITMTQNSSGVEGPSLSATSGVTIQDSTIAPNGSFRPSSSYNLSASSSQFGCNVPALSAVLITSTL